MVVPGVPIARSTAMFVGDGIHASTGDRRISVIAAVGATMTAVGAWIGEDGPSRGVWILVCATAGLAAIVAVGRVVHRYHNSRGSLAAHIAVLIGGLCLLAGVVRSSAEWTEVKSVEFGVFSGEAEVVGDSTAVGRARRVVLEIEGRRFETWVFGALRQRVASLESGDAVSVVGTRSQIDGRRRRGSLIRHVVGRFAVDAMHSIDDSDSRMSALERAANRVRNSLRQGARHMVEERASLFTGLVYGDDSSQPTSMIADFRASGLAHLTAVSGQNVAFVLSACGPFLARMNRFLRFASTIVVLAWFAVMTRLEPSVVRAVFMAGVSALSIGAGRPVSSRVALLVTVAAAILVDPFLLWSVGWWLSVSGCLGLVLLSTPISSLLDRWPHWVSSWVAPTIAAQVGVLGVQTTVFGWPSAVSVPCNLLTAPIAGLVMLTGLPLALVSSIVPVSVGTAVMWPLEYGVAWVHLVARMGARLDAPVSVDVLVSTSMFAVVGRAMLRTRTRSGTSIVGKSDHGHSDVGIWGRDGLSFQRRGFGPGGRRRGHAGEIERR